MKIAITGASGLIGSALGARLEREGHDVRPVARGAAWDPAAGRIDRAALEGADVVVHLAGENTFGRWTAAKMRRIRESRVAGTRLVSEAIAGLARPPRVLLAASAVGAYGDRGDETLTEASSLGNDFLAQVAREWEGATAPAARAGARVVNLRFGVVLTPRGGALRTMLLPFRLGLGGPVGTGRQYFSWITLDDAIGAILHILATESMSGPVNVTAPAPVPYREFARALGRALGRPAILPTPRLALWLLLGAKGAAFVATGQRVLPARLVASGFAFRDREIGPALRRLLSAGA